MTTGYVKELAALLSDLGIDVPGNIRCDQRMAKHLITAIQTAVDEGQGHIAIGNAAVTDVIKDKTFSNAAGIGLVGTLEVPTVAELTADADAAATDILVGKTAYVGGEKLVGTCLLDRAYSTEGFDIALPISAASTAFLLELKPGTLLTMAHNEAACKMYPVSKNAGGTEIYACGGIISSTGEATLYTMVFTVADGVATLTSVKTAAGVEDIANWAGTVGTLIMFKYPEDL